jgi:hypothetical protein
MSPFQLSAADAAKEMVRGGRAPAGTAAAELTRSPTSPGGWKLSQPPPSSATTPAPKTSPFFDGSSGPSKASPLSNVKVPQTAPTRPGTITSPVRGAALAAPAAGGAGTTGLGLGTSVGAAGGGAVLGTVAAGLGIGIAAGEGIRRGGLALEEAGVIPNTPLFEEYPPGFWDRQQPNAAPSPVPVPNPPPFTGGQTPGVFYTVTYRNVGGYGSNRENSTTTAGFFGPVPPLTRRDNANNSWTYGHVINGVFSAVRTWANFYEDGVTSVQSVVRNDGLPDTGGNPDGGSSSKAPPGSVPGYTPASSPLPSPSTLPGLPPMLSPGSPGSPSSPGSPGLAPALPELQEPTPQPLPFADPSSLPGLGIPGLVGSPGAGGKPGLAKPPQTVGDPSPAENPKTPEQPSACQSGCSLSLANSTKNIENNINNIIGGNVVVNSKPTDLTPVLANQEIIKAQNVVTHASQTIMDNKLGPQIPNGGISKFLETMNDFIQAAFEFTKVDKILNALNTILLLHNAAMLSRNLASSLGELATQALSVFGVKDASGNAIDVNEVIGKSFTELAKDVLGETLFTGVTQTWAKANNIISSATQIIWTVRSLADSAREISEWTAENVGKIGNALKKWRVVGENAYNWMPERITAQSKWEVRVNRAREGIESLDDAASSLSGVLGEVQNIQQETQELIDQKQRFTTAIESAIPNERPQNTPVSTAVADQNSASAGKDRALGDSAPGEEL